MNTPIVDFVKKYADSNILRLHMPGHKGEGQLGFEKYDITEIDGADVLYSAEGIIAQSQSNAASIFETQKTFYSTEGSSLCIRAMLQLIKLYALHNGKKPFVAAARNVHKTFVSAAALLDIDVDWLLPPSTQTMVSCIITADYLENYLNCAKQKPIAVYITSPDYLGNITNISSLSRVCKKYGVLLAVDNAHGAYLKFLTRDIHPITMGADICCDSAHKTLPVLTGGAYLHVSKNAPSFFVKNAMRTLSLFASTSPSYLVLQSLDAVNKYLDDNYCEKLETFIKAIHQLKCALKDKGYVICGDEPLKITILAKQYGYTGNELSQLLSEQNIICEFCDFDYIVFMFTLETGIDGINKLKTALFQIPKKEVISEKPPKPILKKSDLSLSQVLYMSQEEIDVEDSLGKIFCEGNVSCPPAVPILLPGETIDENAISSLKYYKIKKCIVKK